MIGRPLSKQTWLHFLPAGVKLLFVTMATIVFFWVQNPIVLLVALGLVLSAYFAAGREAVFRLKLFRFLLPILVIVGLFQFASSGFSDALTSVSRLALMILIADLVTMSTPMMEMMNCIALDWMNMFTMLAMMMPIRPIIRNEPNFDRSRLVV